MFCDLITAIPDWTPSLINLLGSGIIAYGALTKLRDLEALKTFPPKQRLSSPQAEFMRRATEEKLNDIIEWLTRLNQNYKKSNKCILMGFLLLFAGFAIDFLQKSVCA